MQTKRVAFFTYPEWAFGAIHFALCKELYSYGIDADVLDWTKVYTHEEFKELSDLYDIFVTTPCTGLHALINSYGIPSSRIVSVAHGIRDIRLGLDVKNDFNSLLKFAVISPSIKDYAIKAGITKDIQVVRNGIHFNRFYQPTPKKLEVLGYAGNLQHFNVSEGKDCKRRHLAVKLSELTNLPLTHHGFVPFQKMPLYYRKVHSVVVPSDASEACGLPLMESAAAGRLPISAKIGILSEFDNPTGLILPLDEEGFISEGTERIKQLIGDPNKYRSLCKDAQDFARQNYDWSAVIEGWANLFI